MIPTRRRGCACRGMGVEVTEDFCLFPRVGFFCSFRENQWDCPSWYGHQMCHKVMFGSQISKDSPAQILRKTHVLLLQISNGVIFGSDPSHRISKSSQVKICSPISNLTWVRTNMHRYNKNRYLSILTNTFNPTVNNGRINVELGWVCADPLGRWCVWGFGSIRDRLSNPDFSEFHVYKTFIFHEMSTTFTI